MNKKRNFKKIAFLMLIGIFLSLLSCSGITKQPVGRYIILGCDKSASNINFSETNITHGYNMCQDLLFKLTKTLRSNLDKFEFLAFDGEGDTSELELNKSSYNAKLLKEELKKSLKIKQKGNIGTATGSFIRSVTEKIKKYHQRKSEQEIYIVINSDFFDESLSNKRDKKTNLTKSDLVDFGKTLASIKGSKLAIVNISKQNEEKVELLFSYLGKNFFLANQNHSKLESERQIVNRLLMDFNIGGI